MTPKITSRLTNAAYPGWRAYIKMDEGAKFTIAIFSPAGDLVEVIDTHSGEVVELTGEAMTQANGGEPITQDNAGTFLGTIIDN